MLEFWYENLEGVVGLYPHLKIITLRGPDIEIQGS